MKTLFGFILGFFTFFILSATLTNEKSEAENVIAFGPLNQTLFLNCGNIVSIQNSGGYDVTYSAPNATIIPNSDGNTITVIPSEETVNLSINYNGKSTIQKFKAVKSPSPYIEVRSGSDLVNMKTGSPSPGPGSIIVKATPDEFFGSIYPKDSRYKVQEWDAILVRGKRPVATNTFKAENGNLTNFTSTAQPGDRILIEVKSVTRVNFMNQVLECPIPSTKIFNIPLN